MLNEKITKILSDEELIKKLDCARDEEEFCNILAENGATAEDINEFIDHLRNMPDANEGELSEDDLDAVAGGAPILQKALARWCYRFKHKKIFVKATAKNGVITVTNRFGEKVTEEYLY